MNIYIEPSKKEKIFTSLQINDIVVNNHRQLKIRKKVMVIIMKTEKITKKQVKSLRKSLAGTKKKIDWNRIDYEVGRGIISKTKYCLWTDEGYRIDISVKKRGIVVSQSERKDPEYFEMKGKETS